MEKKFSISETLKFAWAKTKEQYLAYLVPILLISALPTLVGLLGPKKGLVVMSSSGNNPQNSCRI